MQEDLFIISKVDLVPDKTFILEDIKVTVLYFVFYFYCKCFKAVILSDVYVLFKMFIINVK